MRADEPMLLAKRREDEVRIRNRQKVPLRLRPLVASPCPKSPPNPPQSATAESGSPEPFGSESGFRKARQPRLLIRLQHACRSSNTALPHAGRQNQQDDASLLQRIPPETAPPSAPAGTSARSRGRAAFRTSSHRHADQHKGLADIRPVSSRPTQAPRRTAPAHRISTSFTHSEG